MATAAPHLANITDEQAGKGLPEHSEEALRAEAAAEGTFRLEPHPDIPRCDKPLLLIVLDGLGESE